MSYQIEEHIAKRLKDFFAKFDFVDKVVVFGSRAKHNANPKSDIDLCVYSLNMSSTQFSILKMEIDELPILYKLDVVHFENSDDALKENIERDGKLLYQSTCSHTEHWNKKNLDEICDILDSKRKPLNKTERENRIKGKELKDLYPYYGATQQAGYIDDYLFDEELILLGEDGVMFYDRDKPKAYLINGKSWVNNHAHVLRVKKDIAVTNYVLYFLNIFNYHGYVTGSTRLKLNRTKMSKIKIPLPSLEEQQKITKKLDKTKELIKLRKNSIKKLDELSKALFVDIFGDPVENEMGWEIVKLGEILIAIDGGWSPVCESYPRKNTNNAVLKLSALNNNTYHQFENKTMKEDCEPKLQTMVKKRDLLFSRKNTFMLVGSCAYVFETEANLFLPDLIFRLNPTDKINSIYLWKYLTNDTIKIGVRNLSNGAAASMPNISKAKLLDFKVKLPPLPLQQKFAKTIEKIEAQKALYEEELKGFEDLFTSLLGRVFSHENTDKTTLA